MKDELNYEERIRLIIDMRWGVYSGKPMNIDKIRKEFIHVTNRKITTEMVRQIIHKYQDDIRFLVN